ncbi:MAG TPA: low molecular weight protein-tyrosine-phosphatase [Jatrophihabitans sp.]|nr:low molecular weight protein-tyrosine-phosphatase [Jatrophihabitans sp.]
MAIAPIRICFVCSGNICRSPTAAVVLTRLAADQGRADLLAVDSAGTGDWHAGDDMDTRARRTLVHGGYDVATHCARQFDAADFERRDLVVALDAGHLHALWWLATEATDVDAARRKIVLLRAFDPQWQPGDDGDVPDPYYGGPDGFREVLQTVESSCAGLLQAVVEAVDGGAPVAEVAARLQQTGRPPL